MSGGLFSPDIEPVKVILVGESGAGKSGALASLLAAGFNVRVLDSDNGVRILRALLLDEVHFPYAKIIKAKGIDLTKAFSRVPIPLDVQFRTVIKSLPGGKTASERLLAPSSAKAWDLIGDSLTNWKGEEGNNLGNIDKWGIQDVLVLDSFTTISRLAYYYNQAMNNRLGAPEEGNFHMKDVGGAQSQLRRLLEAVYSPAINCNVVLICHVNRIDDSAGYSRTPEQARLQDPEAVIEVKGYPESIGVKLSKRVGVFFNDSFIVRQTGEGANTQRRIITTPTTIDGVNIAAKSSAYLSPSYDVRSGLAEIFAALRGEEPPTELLAALSPPRVAATPPAASAAGPVLTLKGRATT